MVSQLVKHERIETTVAKVVEFFFFIYIFLYFLHFSHLPKAVALAGLLCYFSKDQCLLFFD